MDEDQIKSHLSTIDEYVFETKQIVTCSWLSKTLGLHTNISKQLLYTFREKSPKKDELTVTYLIIGSVSEDGPRQMIIAKESDLTKVEKSLANITSKHIYSIQKSLDLTDINVLYTAQKEEYDTLSKGISAIKFDCKERDDKVIEKLKLNALPAVPKVPVGITKKVQPIKENNKDNKSIEQSKKTNSIEGKTKQDVKGDKIPPVAKTNATNKASSNSKKPQGIGAFFSRSASKPSKPNGPVINSANDNSGQELESLPPKENKAPLKAQEKECSPPKEKKAPLKVHDKNNTNNLKATKTESSKISPDKSKKTGNNKGKSATKKVESKQNKKKSSNNSGKDAKKRKRLVLMSDSESNSSCEDDDAQREPTPEPELTPVPEPMDEDIVCGTPEQPKKRKKKLVNKTYISAEGYMVTEKVSVDASGSEDDEGAPEKKFKGSPKDENNTTEKLNEEKVSPKPTAPSPQKKKQASLMSFFKKK